jgi:hypothetical protein
LVLNSFIRPLLATVTSLILASASWSQTDTPTRVPVVISGGHETDPRDHGRPVALVAGGLGVSPEVFRDAFSKVHPVAPGSYPDELRARQNKETLLGALSRYGITNQRLDAVSDHYRYQPGSGQRWPTKSARIQAVVQNGIVTSFEITDGGSGYTSQPTLFVPGHRVPPLQVDLFFGKDLSKNGSISSVTFPR